jgi:RNA polymerase sigma factor (TIGR02999 family)
MFAVKGHRAAIVSSRKFDTMACLFGERAVAVVRPGGIGGEGNGRIMSNRPDHDVTQILERLGERSDASEELLPLVYEQLRAIAQKRMTDERASHTLQATALVHEAYMKLIGDREMGFASRAHFFGAAAEAMRRVLIDHARRRDSQKRGSGRPAAPLSVIDLAADNDPGEILALDEALTKLEEEDPRAAEVVRLRFFAGLGVDETAELMRLSPRTVAREWSFARARLHQLLSEAPG